jgi:putative transcriptional regulator
MAAQGLTMTGMTVRSGAGGLLLALLVWAMVGAEAARPPAGEVLRQPSPDDPITGRLLVATPALEDPNFYHTIVYMVSHDQTGAMGLVINRRLGRGPIGKLLEGLGIEAEVEGDAEIDVHYGGPVERDQSFVLHSPDFVGEDTVMLSRSVALTSSPDVLSAIAAGKGPERSLFALGYAGWAPDQLEQELAAGAWVLVEADDGLLFDPQLESKWQRALDRQGVDL